MNFYKCILFITYIYIHLPKIISASRSDLKLLDTGLESVSPYAIGLQFYIVINNTSEKDYVVELSPEQCCLKTDFNLDCDSMDIIGNCVDNIPKGTKKTMKLIAPVLNPFERLGYCIIYFDSKLTNAHKPLDRRTVKLNFNTNIENKKQSMDLPYNINKCDGIDEDPLDYCKPVQCDIYYNGRKPFYDKKLKRCTECPICVSNLNSELPNAIFNPVSNICIHGRSILDEDIEFIKSIEKPEINNSLDNDLVITSNDKINLNNVKKCNGNKKHSAPVDFTPALQPNIFYEHFRSYIINNKLTIIILLTVVFIQCCLICALIYYVTNKCDCFSKKKHVNKIYNFKTDVSMTTPLIYSNTDTDTTDYKYLSESSNNIDKKIRCYKSCQKERNEVKLSMSDDILSKCLTRRDWIDNKYIKSETMPKVPLKFSQNIKDASGICETNNIEKKERNEIISAQKSTEAKVAFEDEKSDKNQNTAAKDRVVNNIIQKVDYKYNKVKKNSDKRESDSSEREINCLSYDCLNEASKKMKSAINLNIYPSVNKKKGAISLSTDKEAQACFSNDSIDDFLSERGMMFLAGDDISKYTFSCTSNHPKPSSSSEVSSKTSKNNIVKNMLTLLHRRSKQGVSSDPGIQTNDNIDVELLHMSHASVFNSSNDSECIKELTKQHDSRTSL